MSRVLRTALIWLVVIALPLQAVAAATMLGCGFAHHRAVALEVAAPAAHDHAMHSREAAGHDQPAHEQHAVAGDDATVNDGEFAAQDLHELAKFKCSACAVCCSAPALPTSAAIFDPSPQPEVFGVAAFDPSVRFLTGGLERPPRTHLA